MPPIARSYMTRLAFLLVLPALLLSAACNGGLEPSQLGPLPTAPGLTPFPTLPAVGSPDADIAPTLPVSPGLTPSPTLPADVSSDATIAPTLPAAPGLTPFSTLPLYGQPVNDSEAVVTVGESRFAVEVADTPEARQQGLSDRASLDEGAGMLFVYESESQYTFWMNRMHFPLDMIWIDAGCVVADITPDVPPPAPGQTSADLPHFSPNAPVQYVLEVNAGVAAASGIAAGDPVEFGGTLAGKSGC